jgi:hypothetical protein
MPAFDASTLIGGPAIITFDSAVIYTESDIEVTIKRETRDRNVAAFGNLGKILLDHTVEIKFRPAQFKNLDKLFPFLATARGTRVFGSTDKAIVIQSITENQRYTYARGAVTGIPSLNLGVTKDGLIGDMTLTALKANATNLHGANSIVALSTTAFSDTSFDVTKLFDVPYSIAYGSAPFATMDSADGIDVSFDLKLENVQTDQGGLVDMRLDDITMKATFEPRGITHANFLTLLAMQGSGVRRGTFLGPNSSTDLVITGDTTGQPLVTLNKAFITEDSAARFGATKDYQGKVTFMASRRITTGAATAIGSVSTVA